jgi:5-methylcytosine-specific restriction endonuclease McrA
MELEIDEKKGNRPSFLLGNPKDSHVELRFELGRSSYERRWSYLIHYILNRECVERNAILRCCINHCKLSSHRQLKVSEHGVIYEEEPDRQKEIPIYLESECIYMVTEEMKKWTLEELDDIRIGFALGFGESIGSKRSVIGIIAFMKYPDGKDEKLEFLKEQRKKFLLNNGVELEVYKKLTKDHDHEDTIPEFIRNYKRIRENTRDENSISNFKERWEKILWKRRFQEFKGLWNSVDVVIPEHSDEAEKIENEISKRSEEIYPENEEIHRKLFGEYFSKCENEENIEQKDVNQENFFGIKQFSRKNITKELRFNVWDLFIGKEIPISKCMCCGQRDISQNDSSGYICGHIVPVSIGGGNEIHNLRPICSACNLSMGNTNMKTYMEQTGRDRSNPNGYKSLCVHWNTPEEYKNATKI